MRETISPISDSNDGRTRVGGQQRHQVRVGHITRSRVSERMPIVRRRGWMVQNPDIYMYDIEAGVVSCIIRTSTRIRIDQESRGQRAEIRSMITSVLSKLLPTPSHPAISHILGGQ